MNEDKRLIEAAELLKALANPTRMHIVRLLGRHGDLNVSIFVKELNLEQSLVSHHLTKMNDKGMLIRRRQGKEIWYSLADPVLNEVVQMVVR